MLPPPWVLLRLFLALQCEERGHVHMIAFEGTELLERAAVDGKYLEFRTSWCMSGLRVSFASGGNTLLLSVAPVI